MGFPKQIKPNIDLVPPKILSERRRELLEYIQKDGTYLPKSVLHADLDRGMLDFVKDSLKLVVEGKTVPVIDKIITTQNWSQFTETWNFKDPDFNTEPIHPHSILFQIENNFIMLQFLLGTET
jgi:hypothetical protein